MLDRHFVQSFLVMNDLKPQMSDVELSTAFRFAGWSEGEIKRAISLIRNDDPRVQSINEVRYGDVLNSGAKLTSDDLSWLLGVDVIVDPDSVHGAKHGRDPSTQMIDILMVGFGIVLATMCAFGLVWFLMTYTGVS